MSQQFPPMRKLIEKKQTHSLHLQIIYLFIIFRKNNQKLVAKFFQTVLLHVYCVVEMQPVRGGKNLELLAV